MKTRAPLAPTPARVARLAPLLGALALAHSSLLIPAARSGPQVTAAAPVKNFRLPTFTDEGFRQTMIRAGEARLPDPARIDATDVDLTLFTGRADERIDTRLLAPVATLFPQKHLASGPDSVRIERLDLTVTGSDWSYEHGEKVKKIIIRRDAHVVMRATLGDILK